MKKGNFGNRVEFGRNPLSVSLSVSLLVFLSRSCELLGYTGQFFFLDGSINFFQSAPTISSLFQEEKADWSMLMLIGG